MHHILFLDDDKVDRMALERGFNIPDCFPSFLSRASDLFKIVDILPIALVVTDLYMPTVPGDSILTRLKLTHPDLPVGVYSGVDTEPEFCKFFVSKHDGVEPLMSAIKKELAL